MREPGRGRDFLDGQPALRQKSSGPLDPDPPAEFSDPGACVTLEYASAMPFRPANVLGDRLKTDGP